MQYQQQEYDNRNRGVLFKNKKKVEGSKHPDYQGDINIDGTEMRLSAWIKTAKSGEKFMSLSVSPRQDNSGQRPAAKPSNQQVSDDDVPW